MNMEEAFQDNLSSEDKGLTLLIESLNATTRDIKEGVNEGKLAIVKEKLFKLEVQAKKLLGFAQAAIRRATQLTETEDGKILDLSVFPQERV